jgi:hypothetical protein
MESPITTTCSAVGEVDAAVVTAFEAALAAAQPERAVSASRAAVITVAAAARGRRASMLQRYAPTLWIV